MKVYGTLESAQLETKTSDYAGTLTGAIWWHSTDGLVKTSDGTNVRALLRNDAKLIIGNHATPANNTRIHRGDAGLLQLVPGNDATAEGSLATSLNQLDTRIRNTTDAAKGSAGQAGRIAWITDLSQMQVDDGTNWTALGSGSGDGINYITKSSAEDGTTGWVTYDDATATPVDGTGGTVSLTFATTTSSPLRSTKSFLWTPVAAAAGEGVAFDFTIASADKAKVMQILFEYEIGTPASFTEGDTTVWIYDVTNGVMIQPSIYKVPKIMAQGEFQATFQTASNSTSYRLIIHQATAATGYTLKFDRVRVGPQSIAYGSIQTDWYTDWTPTSTWVSNASHTGRWRRDGPDFVGEVYISTSAAPTAATLVVNMPSGLIIDTAKMASTTRRMVGECNVVDGGSNTYFGAVEYSSTTAVRPNYFVDNAATEDFSIINSTSPITFGAGDTIQMKFRVPIVGWGAQGIIGQDAETRVVSARYTSNATLSLASSTTPSIHNFEDFEKDTHGAVTTGASWKFTAPIAGEYLVFAHFKFGALNWDLNEVGTLYVYKNNALYAELDQYRATGTYTLNSLNLKGGTKVPMNAGDYIDIRVRQNTGGSDTSTPGNGECWVSIDRSSGPAAVAVSEEISAKAYGSSQTVNSGAAQIIINPTIDYSSHGAYNNANGVFTCPIKAKYRVTAVATSSTAVSSTTVDTNVYLQLAKNSTMEHYRTFTYQVTGTSITPQLMISATFNCNAGDTLDARIGRDAAVSSFGLSATNKTYVIFEKVP